MIFCSFWRSRARYFAILAVLLAILLLSCAILCVFHTRYYKGHLRYYFLRYFLVFLITISVTQYQMLSLLIHILYQNVSFLRYTEVSNVSPRFFMVSSNSSQYQIIILVSIISRDKFDTFDTIFIWYIFWLILIQFQYFIFNDITKRQIVHGG